MDIDHYIIEGEVETVNRIQSLGLTKESLLEVVGAAVSGRNGVTANDPPGSAGYMSYKEGTRRMRELFSFFGMIRDDVGGVAGVLDAKNNRKFIFCNTDSGTSRKESTPQNISKKGSVSENLVNQANLPILGGILYESSNIIAMHDQEVNAPQSGISVWYLCTFTDGDEIRAELSRPTSCKDGFFSGFAERIFLLTGEETTRPVKEDQDEGDDYGFTVVRKQG